MLLNSKLINDNSETIEITDNIELTKTGNIIQILIKTTGTVLPNSIVIPEEYRPKYDIHFPCSYLTGTNWNSDGNVSIGISHDGFLGLFALGVSELTYPIAATTILYIIDI